MSALREDYTETALFLDTPLLTTERLILRPPHEDDAEELASLANNLNIARMLAHMPHPYSLDDANAFIARAKRNEGRACIYSVTEAESGLLVGVGSLHTVESEDEPHLGYWIGEPYWGKGYATEAARALVDLYFKVTSRAILRVSARVTNEASIKIIKKCGGQYSHSSSEKHPLLGEMQQLEHYEITRESWMGEIAA